MPYAELYHHGIQGQKWALEGFRIRMEALVDIEDWGYTELPLVILDPEKSMQFEKYTKIV